MTALRGYGQIRDRLCPAPVTTAFFVSTRGTRINSHNMPYTFATLTEAAGITTAACRRRARIHDIRHYVDGWVMWLAAASPLVAEPRVLVPAT